MDDFPRRPAFCWQSKDALRQIREAFDRENCVSSALAVYMALTELASNAGRDEFTAFQAQIATMSGLSIRTVFDRLQALKEIGLVEIEAQGLRTSCKYTLAGRSVRNCVQQPLPNDTQPLPNVRQPTFSTSVADSGKKRKEPKGVFVHSGAFEKPLTVEPLRGGSGLNGSGHSMEWLEPPKTEKEFLHLMEELAENMEDHGGKWRNRWRANGGPEKCRKVLADFLQASGERKIDRPGGYMNDNWKRWFEK